MPVTITIPDDIAIRYQKVAQAQYKSIEDFAITLLDDALILAPLTESDYCPTPEEVVAKIQSLPPNPNMIRPAVGSLSEYLTASIAAEDPNEKFDLEEWNRNWDGIEAEMNAIDRRKALERERDLMEGLRG